MSVTQAMEWLIEHVDDPTVDAPIPGGQDSSGAAGATAATPPGPSVPAPGPNLLHSQSSQSSTEESIRQDELTEIFKRIRRKREFRPDSRVSGFIPSELSFRTDCYLLLDSSPELSITLYVVGRCNLSFLTPQTGQMQD